jgi:hypothetical protein
MFMLRCFCISTLLSLGGYICWWTIDLILRLLNKDYQYLAVTSISPRLLVLESNGYQYLSSIISPRVQRLPVSLLDY